MKVDQVEFALSRSTEAELVAIAEATYAKPAHAATARLMAGLDPPTDSHRHRQTVG